MDLRVGQHAYIIPFTRVVVQCPVEFFDGRDLIWRHEARPERLGYTGRNVSRVHVDREGSLVIASFQPLDAGIWHCQAGLPPHPAVLAPPEVPSTKSELAADSNAGPVEATVTLLTRSSASGFADWVQRNALWLRRREGWLNEDAYDEDGSSPGSEVSGVGESGFGLGLVESNVGWPVYAGLVRRDLIQWVEAAWSVCPPLCGPDASPVNQTRVVRCERIDRRQYQILNESACLEKTLQKPVTQRPCDISKECPKWQLRNVDFSVAMFMEVPESYK
ncbi:unnamed protein product [Protopolystoma xenopodis]|uniref:Ig-like domain-containing protein n=1 Tax=Protopolystoma xenopodis TaxID=117903 RepID=A0A3S5A9S6_9PLAT|nr:unnamed protein product [Protopolystoma xenopodis]